MSTPVTFGLVHGSWHGAWCWEPLQTELDKRGYRSVAMDLPIDDPSANFNDYAEVVVDSLKEEPDLVLVGHSRAGNVTPRAAGRLPVRQLIHLCASFEPATIGHPTEQEASIVPERNSQQFLQGIVQTNNGLTVFDRALAPHLFYPDCSPALQTWAVNHLRPQRRSDDEPALLSWPDVAQVSVICTQDRVVSPAWSTYAARHWLGLQPLYFSSGHSPFLAKPKALARLLISLSQ